VGIDEKIPIDITIPTRVALELRKRGLKCCDPHDLTVTKFRAVLITHKYKGTVIYEIGIKIDRFGLFAFCQLYGKNAQPSSSRSLEGKEYGNVTGWFSQSWKEMASVLGKDTKAYMRNNGLELIKDLMPGPPKRKISAKDFRHIINHFERWVRYLQSYFERLKPLV
jgi:hypothetical protein